MFYRPRAVEMTGEESRIHIWITLQVTHSVCSMSEIGGDPTKKLCLKIRQWKIKRNAWCEIVRLRMLYEKVIKHWVYFKQIHQLDWIPTERNGTWYCVVYCVIQTYKHSYIFVVLYIIKILFFGVTTSPLKTEKKTTLTYLVSNLKQKKWNKWVGPFMCLRFV